MSTRRKRGDGQGELFRRSIRPVITIEENHRLVRLTEELDWTELELVVEEIRRQKLQSEAGRPPALAPEAPGAHIDALVTRIRRAIAGAPKPKGDLVDAAVRANVAASVKDVQSSRPVIAPLVQAGKVKVIGARYHLDTGAVELLRESR